MAYTESDIQWSEPVFTTLPDPDGFSFPAVKITGTILTPGDPRGGEVVMDYGVDVACIQYAIEAPATLNTGDGSNDRSERFNAFVTQQLKKNVAAYLVSAANSEPV